MVKKYIPYAGEAGLTSMVESPDGGYVTAADYNLLARALREVASALDEMSAVAADGAANLRKAVAA